MFICKYCNQERKNRNSLRNHERLCKLNPNKKLHPKGNTGKKGKNQYIKAEELGLPKPKISEAGRKKIALSTGSRDYSIIRANRPALVNYRSDCKFKFNLSDYPNEFDFLLIEKYGWYKTSNRGNNLYGVSRDHIISVKYGFDNNISSNYISHPANCRLLKHNENLSKGVKCGMSLEELLLKIENWNKKYIHLC